MPIEPTLAELLETVHRSYMLDVHTSMPGRVRSYDAATQTADVEPLILGALQDEDGFNVYEARPVIQNVPVRWERAGDYYDHKPLTADNCGWLIFSEDSYAQWRTTGEVSVPGDLTRHSLSYPFFLPGAWPDGKRLPDAPASGEAVSIVPSGGRLRVSTANPAHVELVALAGKVAAQLTALKQAISDAAPVPNDGGAALKAAILGALAGWPESVASTTLAAEGDP
jgi:hypothetical protein